MTGATAYSVVIPTIGRPCLADCLRALAAADDHPPEEVVVVDDRRAPTAPLPLETAGTLRVRTLRTGGRGPAAARNTGWRTLRTPWTVFLDDDVQVLPDWSRRLADDLGTADAATGGIQGRLRVPLPKDRRPTDWERGTAGLEHAAWATADMAYRTAALAEVQGFDERFGRAFREDADLALRVREAGWSLHRGTRVTRHPVRPSDRWASVRAQRGNADDALMTRLHGPDWWTRAEAPRGRLPRHALVTSLAITAPALALTSRRRAAGAAAALWALGTAEFTLSRIRPGPRTRAEITTMLTTSLVIPPLAVHHWLNGLLRHRRATPLGGTAAGGTAAGGTAAGETPAGQHAGGTPAGDTTGGDPPTEGRRAGASAGDAAVEDTAAKNTTAGDTPARGTPIGVPAKNTTADETPAGNTPAKNTAADDAPVRGAPAEASAGDTAAGHTPVQPAGAPATDTPIGDTPIAEPAGDPTAEDTAAGNTAAEGTPVGDAEAPPVGEKPARGAP
ncbi:hypothetical protein GCM10010276_52340 [Streptomyces longisporus]|uniref:Glycosyltransferase 2-like domain-containing protein n=1 Tax=Streptomyces longisporus TaxID=1948 RepID=A0ABP5ZT11_STRLO